MYARYKVYHVPPVASQFSIALPHQDYKRTTERNSYRLYQLISMMRIIENVVLDDGNREGHPLFAHKRSGHLGHDRLLFLIRRVA